MLYDKNRKMILTPSQESRFTSIFHNLSMEERGKFLRLFEKKSTVANPGYLYSSHIKKLKSREVIAIKFGMNVNSENQELYNFLDELIYKQPKPIKQSKQKDSSKNKINVPNHNIDALIFLGVTRAKIQLKKANAGNARFYFDYGYVNKYQRHFDNPYINKLKALPRASEIHGVSLFKQDYIRELIYLIADDNFWMEYQNAFSYKKKQSIENADRYRFTSTPDIIYCDGCFAERSILLRLLYVLCGFNPYKQLLSWDSQEPKKYGTDVADPGDVTRKMNFELSKIELAIQRVYDFVSFNEPALPRILPNSSFSPALDVALELLEKSEKSLAGLSELWRHQMYHDQSSQWDPILSDPIKKDVLLQIWGGTLKSFKREQKENFKKGEPVLDLYSWGGSKTDYVMLEDAIKFLESKGIDTTLKNKKRLDDFSYKYIAYLEKKISEDSTGLTMKSAINALEENDISDKSMRYVVI